MMILCAISFVMPYNYIGSQLYECRMQHCSHDGIDHATIKIFELYQFEYLNEANREMELN